MPYIAKYVVGQLDHIEFALHYTVEESIYTETEGLRPLFLIDNTDPSFLAVTLVNVDVWMLALNVLVVICEYMTPPSSLLDTVSIVTLLKITFYVSPSR